MKPKSRVNRAFGRSNNEGLDGHAKRFVARLGNVIGASAGRRGGLRERPEFHRDGDSGGNRVTLARLGGGAWQRAAESIKTLQSPHKAKAKTLFFNSMDPVPRNRLRLL